MSGGEKWAPAEGDGGKSGAVVVGKEVSLEKSV
jgi:hypothetical protein